MAQTRKYSVNGILKTKCFQKYLWRGVVLVVLGYCLADVQAQPSYTKQKLTASFYCEGAYFGDFNRDGSMDIVSGPFWYAGPEFTTKAEIHAVVEYDPHGYSENFLTYTDDFNADGWIDVLYVPWPGKDAVWYENPKGESRHWTAHRALANVGNESPAWTDINGDGRDDLVFNIDGYLGFATWDPKTPDAMWTFHRVSDQRETYQRYTHGLGCGDINRDGKLDIVEAAGWWEQPQTLNDQTWIWHSYQFAEAGAQMLVYDIDGDGLDDVATAWHCHLYGLVWHQQVRDNLAQIEFKKHTVLSPSPTPESDDFRISQMHAQTLADINGDGLLDIVTGKRFWAHGPNGDAEPGAPAVLYWFELTRDAEGTVKFVPHRIDDDSGVGTQVTSVDLNRDNRPDLIVGNKKGTFLFLSRDVPK